MPVSSSLHTPNNTTRHVLPPHTHTNGLLDGIVPSSAPDSRSLYSLHLYLYPFYIVPPYNESIPPSPTPPCHTPVPVNQARLPAAMTGALVSGGMSHPFDTIKTCMQGDIERVTYGSMRETAAVIHKEHGVSGFYRGFMWRYTRQGGEEGERTRYHTWSVCV